METFTATYLILASQVEFKADVDVDVRPVIREGRHEIQFECVMSKVNLTTAPGNQVLFDVIWYIHKSGKKREVHREEGVPGPLTLQESVLALYPGLDVNVRK